MALSCNPRPLIADELTTAVDVTTQAQVLRLLRRLEQERNAAIIFILLAPVKRVCVPDTPIPFAPSMERAVVPQEEDIAAAVRAVLKKN